MAIKPLGDRVLIEPVEEKEEKIGNIFIPDTAKEKQHQGTIIAVGQGKVTDEGKTVPPQVSVGQKVLYGKYSGTEIKENGKDYLIIKEADILAVIE